MYYKYAKITDQTIEELVDILGSDCVFAQKDEIEAKLQVAKKKGRSEVHTRDSVD